MLQLRDLRRHTEKCQCKQGISVPEVTGKWRNKSIGLKIPASYSFYHKKPSKVKKLIELLIRDKEDKAERNWCRNTIIVVSMSITYYI